MEHEERTDRFAEAADRFTGYEVYDQSSEKIGRVDDLFIDENANYEYVGVRTGLLGTKTTLIPWQMIQLDDDTSSPTSQLRKGEDIREATAPASCATT